MAAIGNFLLLLFSANLFASAHPSGHKSLPSSSNNSARRNIHAVLIAGTSGWFNYRHQANIAHSYKLLRSKGIPEENIIVMSVDDVAHSEENPFKGKLFNSPDGQDVYSGLKVDYSGDQVTPENFLTILNGQVNSSFPTRSSSLPVLRSGPNDIVLIYISTYGAIGLFNFPKNIITRVMFNKALIDMHNRRQFDQLMVYLDSDYSASMFNSDLPTNVNITSVPSTSSNQVNYACFCNTSLAPYTCLADYNSVILLTKSAQSVNTKSNDQVVSYSSNSIDSLHKSDKFTQNAIAIRDQLSSFDVPIEMSKLKSIATFNDEKLNNVLNARQFLNRAFYHLIDDLCWSGYCTNATKILSTSKQVIIVNETIYNKIITKFNADCLNLGKNTYALTKMYAFANMIKESEVKLLSNLNSFLSKMYQGCRRRIIGHGYDYIV